MDLPKFAAGALFSLLLAACCTFSAAFVAPSRPGLSHSDREITIYRMVELELQ